MPSSKENSLSDILYMNEEEFQEFFKEQGGSVVVIPDKAYVIDWNSIDSFEKTVALLKAITEILLPKVITMGELELSKSGLKPFLKEKITTSVKLPDPD